MLVAAPIAQRLRVPLHLCMVRKIGSPFNPEAAIGAIGPSGAACFDQEALAALGLGVLVSFGLTASLALTAFWVEDNAPFFWIYSKINFVLGGLFLPVEVYPGFLRTLAEILPFRLIFSAPARLAVRFDPVLLIRTLIAQAVWAAYLLALAWLIYGKGVRKLNVNGG